MRIGVWPAAFAAVLAAAPAAVVFALEADGASFERAIVIRETTTREGIAAEYEHLRRAYPGWRRTRQALLRHEGRMYDVLTIVSPGGEERQIFFAIDAFFGRM